jgi:hypothetical protein
MSTKITYNTASIAHGQVCRDYGWPIIDVCCNGTFTEYKDAAEWDWWYYCSNKSCRNHDGEGIFQDTPEWIVAESEPTNSEGPKK